MLKWCASSVFFDVATSEMSYLLSRQWQDFVWGRELGDQGSDGSRIWVRGGSSRGESAAPRALFSPKVRQMVVFWGRGMGR